MRLYTNINISDDTKTIVLSEAQAKRLHKHLLTERLSSVVYHFTGLSAAYKILSTDVMYLQSSYAGSNSDNYGNRPFYISLTRNRNTSMSYAKNYSHRNSGVRIEFDGDMLNNDFKGVAVDYWGKSMGKQSYYNEPTPNKEKMTPRLYNGEAQSHSRNETEDRLLSNESTIEGISRYIKRVDVFLIDAEKYPYDTEYVKALTRIENIYSKLHIYNNLKDFNSQSGNEITEEMLSKSFDGINIPQDSTDKFSQHFVREALIDFFTLTSFYDIATDNKHWKQDIGLKLQEYGLKRYINGSLLKDIQYKVSNGLENQFHALQCDSKELSTHNPSDDGQKVLQLISDYMRESGYTSIPDWYTKLKQESRRNTRYSQNDPNKIVDVIFYDTESTIENKYFWSCKNYSVNPDKDSFWKLIDCNSYDDRMYFLDSLKERSEEWFDGDANEYKEPTYQHKSKSDESFYKYLQHLAKNEPSVNFMIDMIVNKMNISLDDKNVFGCYRIVKVPITCVDAPSSLVETGIFEKK